MQINLSQTHHEIGDFEEIFKELTETLSRPNSKGLYLFPELFLTGYPLQDLVLQKSFYKEYLHLLEDINHWSKKLPKTDDAAFAILGGLKYFFDSDGNLEKIQNVAYKLVPGHELEIVATKTLLPNYDLYEEKKYFSKSFGPSFIEHNGKKIGILICEDMWHSHLHDIDPVMELKKMGPFDFCINLSASPWHIHKLNERIKRSCEISHFLQCPYYYVNRVGFEDEIIFDGQSFGVNGDEIIGKSLAFKKDLLTLSIPHKNKDHYRSMPIIKSSSSWNTIFHRRLNDEKNRLVPLEDYQLEEILEALKFSLQEYAKKTNMNKFLIALSGGMDSALVLAIAKLSLQKDQSIEAVYMPGFFSSSLSYDLACDLARNLSVKFCSFPIKFIHSTVRNNYKDNFRSEMQGLCDENIQSRLRGALIYARSNETGSMVINTSNKSELAVGYSTLYGDSVGALSLLGDLYKTEVFELAKFINRKYNKIIPEEIISRPPSAELRDNQTDEASLLPYPELDALLENYLSYQCSIDDAIKLGFNPQGAQKIFNLWQRSEYKRKQFCPIVKLKPKSFGFGNRNPILKKL